MSEISKKQLEANRENAKLGGVKTEEGKAVSKLNALKHGLLSKEVLLEKEDEQSLIELGKRLRNEIKPTGELEVILTDRIVANFWRLKRLLKVERVTMEWQKDDREISFGLDEESESQKKKRKIKAMIVNNDIEVLLRYETAIERSIYKALHELQRLQATRLVGNIPAPVAIDVDVSGIKE